MSCCGNRGSGAGARCTCKVVAGDGATVTGRGSSSDPYVISANGGGENGGENAPDWPHDCPADEIGQPVFKDENGNLVTDTAIDTRYSFNNQEQRPGPTKIPEGDLDLTTATIELENPDQCREARLIIEVQSDIDLTLPPGASAYTKLGGEEMTSLTNGGTAEAADQHIQVSKNYYNYVLDPGQKWTFKCPQAVGGGTGDATYNRHQWYVKALMIIGTRRNDEAK